MKRKHMAAFCEALTLAAELDARLPASVPVTCEDLVGACWPLVYRLTVPNYKARKDAKAAKHCRRPPRRSRRGAAPQTGRAGCRSRCRGGPCQWIQNAGVLPDDSGAAIADVRTC
jgi:hypothetical protein